MDSMGPQQSGGKEVIKKRDEDEAPASFAGVTTAGSGSDVQRLNITAEGSSNINAPALSHNNVQGSINITTNIHHHGAETSTVAQQPKKLDGLFPKCQQVLKEKLSKKFQNVRVAIPKQGQPASLEKIYTELYITEGECIEVCTEHEVRQIEMVSRKKTTNGKTLIKYTDIFKPLPGQDKDIRTVITKGVAGIGKTVSVQKFILDWAGGEANQDIHFLLPVPFREINLIREKEYTLMGFIHHFFSETSDLIFSTDEKYKVAFIFDGLDESRLPLDFQNNECIYNASEPTKVDVLLTNLIKGNLLPSAQIWITSRPAAASQIPPECVDQVTEVQGFTDLQKEEYLKKNIDDQEKASRIITHLKSSRSLYIMCHIPVFCWMAATVLVSILTEGKSDEIPTSMTQMYLHFLILHAKHISEKYKVQWKQKTILSLGRLAFQQLEKGNLIFSEDDLNKCGMDVTEAKEASVYSGVCTQIFREESGLDQQKVFCFVHLSIQEFLAALYVFLHFSRKSLMSKILQPLKTVRSNSPLQSLLSAMSLHELHQAAVKLALKNEHGHLDLFLRFLLGLTLQSNQRRLQDLLPQEGSRSLDTKKTIKFIKENIRKVKNPERCINLFHCLNELNDHSLVKEVQGYMQKAKKNRADLSLSQLSALAFALQMSDQEVEEFDLRDYGSHARSDAGLLRMLPVVKISRTVKLLECRLNESSCSYIAAALSSSFSSLQHLNLRNNRQLGDSGVKLLSAGLEHPNCRLETLELGNCSITAEGCAALASALASNPSSHLIQLDLDGNQLRDSGMKHISDQLKNPDCKLQTLTLGNCSITAEGCAALASALASNPSSHLIQLDLDDNQLRDSGMKHISDQLRNPDCKLQTLTLGDCSITTEGCAALASALASNPSSHLMHLDLDGKQLGDSGVKHISDLLRNPDCKLQTLKLGTCRLTTESCAALASALTSNPSSHQLQLNLKYEGYKLGDSGVKHISDLLRNPDCQLQELDLRHCSITAEGCADLVSALASNPSSHLTHLYLSHNELGDSGVKQLSTLLRNPDCKLQTLWLQSCSITAEGGADLNPSSHLTELDLGFNELGDSGVKQLSTLLRNPDCKLQKLRLQSCSITAEGCADLVLALASNPSSYLTNLYLDNNNLGDSGVKQISTLLRNPECKLQKLELWRCSITAEGCAALVSALKANPSSHLTHLYLLGNRLGASAVQQLSALEEDPNYKLQRVEI